MPLTPAQQEAVDRTNLGRDVCVVAGPGSGKTRVLVDYYELLAASGVPPSRILAITFTEKAASNMKERLATTFAGRPDLRRELERANVSTVHGFCARLLRENAIFAGVDPEFRVLDEQESLTMQRSAVAAMLDRRWLENPSELGALLRAVECLDLGEAVMQVYDAVRASGRPLASLRDDTPPAAPGFDSLLDAADAVARVSQRYENECVDSVLEWGERFAHLRGTPVSLEHFAAVRDITVNLNKVRRHPARDLLRPLSKDGREPVIRRMVTELYAAERVAVLDILEDFERSYRAAKDRSGALDFADLEDATVRLLEERADVRARIRAQFDQVLMDEYQDTNGLQARLVELVRPPDRFFAVGDINQSIYGFRHADPDVFRSYRDSATQPGKRLVNLPENFRSRPDILRFVEGLLSNASGIERRGLIPAREFVTAAAGVCVEAIAAIAPDIDAALAIEARWIARRIRDFEGSLTLEHGPAAYGDIAILVRNSEVMDEIGSALEEFGIPYLVSRGKGFFETREVRDLTHLLRILVNPLDEVSLATVLRSPFVAASDDALMALKEAGTPAAALRRVDELPLDPADRAKLERFAAQLERWRAQSDAVSFDRLLLRAIDDTGYPFEPGTRAAANIEKFLAMARHASGRSSLFEFVGQLELVRESDPREADAPPEDAVNAVRVMTVHAAKGLEFPIVFVAAMNKGVSKSMGALTYSPRIGLGVRWRDPSTGDSKGDLFERAIREESAVREQEESNRLLYVAMTRAEERLILSFSANGRRIENWAGQLNELLPFNLDTPTNEPITDDQLGPDGALFPVRILCASRVPEVARGRQAAEEAAAAVEVLAPAARDAQHDTNATVTAVNLFANCPRRYFLARYLGWEGGVRKLLAMDTEIDGEPDLPADVFGRQVHALLAGQTVEDPDPEAVALATSFAATDLGRRAARATLIEREFDYIADVEGVILRGQIDLWFEEAGELVLVDYKTDRIKAAESESRALEYQLQLRLYAHALAQLTGRQPDRAYVHFLRLNRSEPVSLAPTLFDDPLHVAREFRDAQDRLHFPLREGDHCRQCPFVAGLCPAARP